MYLKEKMVKTVFLISSICFLAACANTKQAALSNEPFKKDIIELLVSKEIKLGSMANFSFLNNTNEKIIIYGPAFKNIEKLENGNWRSVKTIYCPCGADCIPPPKTKTLLPGEKHQYSWNLLESWCDKRMKNENKMTVENSSKSGLYRTTIYYSKDSLKQEKLVREFNLVN